MFRGYVRDTVLVGEGNPGRGERDVLDQVSADVPNQVAAAVVA